MEPLALVEAVKAETRGFEGAIHWMMRNQATWFIRLGAAIERSITFSRATASAICRSSSRLALTTAMGSGPSFGRVFRCESGLILKVFLHRDGAGTGRSKRCRGISEACRGS